MPERIDTEPTERTVINPAPDPRAVVLGLLDSLVQRRCPYVWGGDTPEGADCSGAICWAWRQAVIVPPGYRVRALDLYDSLLRVPAWLVLPGDVVLFAHRGQPVSHVMTVVDEDRLVGAVGGDSRVRTVADALARDARVRYEGRGYRVTEIAGFGRLPVGE